MLLVERYAAVVSVNEKLLELILRRRGGGGNVSDEKLAEAVNNVFDLRPSAIIRNLGLRKPIYRQLASYGHIGREDLGVEWEKLNMTDQLKKAVQ